MGVKLEIFSHCVGGLKICQHKVFVSADILSTEWMKLHDQKLKKWLWCVRRWSVQGAPKVPIQCLVATIQHCIPIIFQGIHNQHLSPQTVHQLKYTGSVSFQYSILHRSCACSSSRSELCSRIESLPVERRLELKLQVLLLCMRFKFLHVRAAFVRGRSSMCFVPFYFLAHFKTWKTQTICSTL